MTSLGDLKRYERPACASCGALAPEVVVPRGEGAISCCWLCAHAIVDHGAQPGAPASCGCSAEEIYPADVLARRPNPPMPKLLVAVDPGMPKPVMVIYSPSYNLDGKVDRDGPVMVQRFEQVAPGALRPLSMTLEKPRSIQIARGMRSARAKRS